MNECFNKQTMAERLDAYLSSDDFGLDMHLKSQEYLDADLPVPSSEEIRNQVIAEKLAWMEDRALCESEGHAWIETADPENGTSDFNCVRCGEHQLLHW